MAIANWLELAEHNEKRAAELREEAVGYEERAKAYRRMARSTGEAPPTTTEPTEPSLAGDGSRSIAGPLGTDSIE